MNHTRDMHDHVSTESAPSGREFVVPEGVELWEVSEQLLIAGLHQHELAGHLSRQLAFSRTITESLVEGVVAVDGAQQVTFINPAAEHLLGWRGADLLGKDLQRVALVHGTAGTKPSESAVPVVEVLRDGAIYRDTHAVFRRKDGTVFPVAYSIAPIITGGHVVGAVVAFRDIAEEQRLQQLRDEYLQLISHDLRGPLAVILGYAQMLQERLAAQGLAREGQHVTAIVDSSTRMNRLIQDLLDRSLMEARPTEFHLVLIDLVQVLERSVNETIPPVERSRLAIEAGGPLLVGADPSQIERVISNLLTNALKYSPPDSPVVVRLNRVGQHAMIAVMDRGVGIPLDEMPHLFEKHYRASTAGTAAGLGLGLYGSRLIAEAHGGRIWAESTVGTGSIFMFSLPINAP
jgi:PAS domain S-box-containing protein